MLEPHIKFGKLSTQRGDTCSKRAKTNTQTVFFSLVLFCGDDLGFSIYCEYMDKNVFSPLNTETQILIQNFTVGLVGFCYI